MSEAKPTAVHYMLILSTMANIALTLVAYFALIGKAEAEARASAAEQRAALRP